MKIQISDKVLLKCVVVIFTILLLYLFSVLVSQNKKMYSYFELNKGLIRKYAKEKDSLIEVKNKEITILLELNNQKQIKIEKALDVIDSLQKEKNKIKIVYKDRKGKIKELNSDELEKYWKDEIK